MLRINGNGRDGMHRTSLIAMSLSPRRSPYSPVRPVLFDLLHTKELEAQAPVASGQVTSVNQQLIEAIQMPQYDRDQLQADLSRCEQLLEKLTVRVGELREDLMESAQRNTQRAEVISGLQVMPLSPSHWMTD